MVTMNEFKELLKGKILDYLPDTYKEASVTFEQVQKNNGVTLDALIVRRDEVNISPTIYLEDFLKEYQSGRELRDILHDISKMQQKFDLGKSVDISMLTEWDAIKEKIVPRIVSAKENEEMLKGRPHTIVEDLAVIYQIEMGHSDDGASMSTAVHNGVFEQYGVSLEELHRTAIANIEPVMHPKLMSMRDMLSTMMPDGMEEDMLPPEDPTGMHILRCDSKNYGAAVILNEKTMDDISEKFGSFFILPSSVHECIILPDDGNATVSELESLVREVNETQVAEQEILSGHVYRYDRDTKEIYRADREEEHLAKVAEKTNEKSKVKGKEKKPSVMKKLKEKKAEAALTESKAPSQSKKREAVLS